MTFEEADERLAGGWHVVLPEPGPMCSAQRKRYLRLERERLLALSSVALEIRQVSHHCVCFLNLGSIEPKVFSLRNPCFFEMSMHFLFDLLVVAATN